MRSACEVVCSLLVVTTILHSVMYGPMSATNSPTSVTDLRRFVRDHRFNDRKVTTDQGSEELTATFVTKCAALCSQRAWCTSFFYVSNSGTCTLHAVAFVDDTPTAVAVGAVYYRHLVDRCKPEDGLLYNRLAQMCVYFETNPTKRAWGWLAADTACVGLGMRLAHDITPLKMDALMNMTQKNTGPSMHKSPYIGLKRTSPRVNKFEWISGTPLDTAAMAPYWGENQPNGHITTEAQDCVLISPNSPTIHDVSCVDCAYVCEKL